MLSSLPIDNFISKVQQGFNETCNVILTAPPGSGKTLRVPAALTQRLIKNNAAKKIVVLVPKRIAAISAAERVAEENNWNLGDQVGYQVRFEQKFTESTKLIFMTEGVFVKKMSQAAFLNSIDTIIFDEFHERSSLNDIAFGFCFEQQWLTESTEKLKILVMSATLETKKLELFLQNAVTIDILLNPFPLQIIKSKKAQRLQFDFTLVEQIIDVTKEALRQQKKDILIFLPGLHEIRQVKNKLSTALPNTFVEILHGSISLDDQKRILKPYAQRRIILSTNIAESSLTLPTIDCVIDTGLEKKPVYEKKIGFQRLELKRISLFSARQRAGRAARIGPGTCYQLWHESDEKSMSEQIEPEIMKSSLLEETLILASLGVTQPKNFSWLDQPTQNFDSILEKFKNWQLVDHNLKVTSLGLDVHRCPLDLESSLLFVKLSYEGHQTHGARLIAFIESSDFSKINHLIDLEDLQLNDLGRKIENQLLKINFNIKLKSPKISFRDYLIKLYFTNFPEKMAQRKDLNIGVSSLGRGVQFLNHLIQPNSDYFILLRGRDISDSITLIEFAVSFTQKEFEQISNDSQKFEENYIIDFEKIKIYKQQRKVSGFFTLSIGTKTPLDEKNDKNIFKFVFQNHIEEFIQHHPHSTSYFRKIHFLKKKWAILGYSENLFSYLNEISPQIYSALKDIIISLSDFLNYDLYQLLVYLTPEPLKSDLQKLPATYKLISGKTIPIDYESELSPMISVRIQELLGVFKTPTLLDHRLALTVELLAPNFRPTQVTSDLENFWKNSYLDVRKDLRARYPKHDWPENPLDWKPEMSKKFKK